METLLQNPAIQGGVAPFIVAILVALLGYRSTNWSALAVLGSFLVAVTLTTGIQFEPLTSTRKILILIICAAVAGGGIALLKWNKQRIFMSALIIAGAGAVWIAWPVLKRETDVSLQAGMVVVIFAYAGFISAWINSLLSSRTVVEAGSSSVSFALTLGVAIIISASALLGQMAISIGAGVAGWMLVNILLKKHNNLAGTICTMTAGTALSLLAIAGVLYAQLPWYALIPTIAIPWLGNLRLNTKYNVWTKSAIMLFITALPGFLTVYLAWNSAGEVYY